MRPLMLCAALAVAGCYDQHAERDAGPDPCRAGSFALCGEGCPPCSSGECLSGVCSAAPAEPCHVPRSPDLEVTLRRRWCPGFEACWFDGEELPPEEREGRCVPPEVCLSDSPLLGPHRCFWSDGSEVTRVPAPLPCPAGVSPVFCGRGPGCTADCREGPTFPTCRWLADDRGLGLCVSNTLCDPADPRISHLSCDYEPGSCRCMVGPTPSTVERPFGMVVPRLECERYNALVPGIRCIP